MKRKGTRYKSATAGKKAREEISKVLRHFGCEEIGFADKFDATRSAAVLQASRSAGASARVGEGMGAALSQGAAVELQASQHAPGIRAGRASGRGTSRSTASCVTGSRDKSLPSNVACSQFEAVFMPFMFTSDGRPVIERDARICCPSRTNRRSCRCQVM